VSIPVLTDYSPSYFNGRRVLVRVDYNVPLQKRGEKWLIGDDSRIRSSLDTLSYLVSSKARVILLSHLGKPISLAPVAQKLNELAFGLIGYKRKVKFCPKIVGKEVKGWVKDLEKGDILLLENLRLEKGEEKNDPLFAKRLAKLADFYVNDAFSCSHRRHASIVGIPRILPHAVGSGFEKDIKTLKNILEHSQRPVVLVLGGIKEDKLKTARKMVKWVDKILVGGTLVKSSKLKVQSSKKIILGKLRRDGQDISKTTIKRFIEEIKKAGTVIFAGPIGNTGAGIFTGTKRLFEAAIESDAFVLAGGGDTQSALTRLGLADNMNYIVSGGGAMLSFLADGTLPGIEALRN